MKIQVKILDKEFIEEFGLPEYKTEGAVAMDLRARIPKDATPNQKWLTGRPRIIPTGIAIAVPEGYEAQVRPRSGQALDGLCIANSPGTIDSDYRGEVGVILYDLVEDRRAKHLERGERIAQLVIVPVVKAEWEVVDELPETKRGSGGYGSTGRQ